MTIQLRWMPFVLALAVATPVSAFGAVSSQMQAFNDCVLPPTLVVYHNAVVASDYLAHRPEVFQNRHAGANFNQATWLYALRALKVVSKCPLPANPNDALEAVRVRSAAETIINGYIHFTWNPTREKMASEWTTIQGGYDQIHRAS